MRKDKQDNRGFTLVELLLSIVLLAILLLPALYGFISAAKINKEANEMQVETSLAQNVLETVKNLSIGETAIQFYGKDAMVTLRNNYNFETYSNDGYGEYIKDITGKLVRVEATDSLASVDITTSGSSSVYSFNPPADRKTFYFGMLNVTANGGAGYDALVTLDAAEYSDTSKYNNTMNNYKMPELLDLNQEAVAVIDLEGMTTTWSNESATALMSKTASTDDQAINDFMNLNSAYISALASKAAEDGIVITLPTPIEKATIIDKTKKAIDINIIKDVAKSKVYVKCTITYTCNMDLNGDTFNETLAPIEVIAGSYPIPAKEEIESSIYLFYTPSVFLNKDVINIVNNEAKANVYIANQQTSTTSRVTINKSDTLSVTNILTNLTATQRTGAAVNINNLYEEGTAKNRIYKITVSVYQAGALATGSPVNPLATLTSTSEQ